MLRKLMWTGLNAGVTAVAAIAARRVTAKVWHVLTGEEPPTKRA